MTIKQLKKAIELLEVNVGQLATLLGKHPNSIDNYLKGKIKIARNDELALEALINRKLDGRLWEDLVK